MAAGCGDAVTEAENQIQAGVTATSGLINPGGGTIAVGESRTFTAQDAAGNTLTTNVQWHSSNPAVASVGYSTGVVKGLAAGTIKLTAYYQYRFHASVALTVGGTAPAPVTPVLTRIALTPATTTLTTGQTVQLHAQAFDQNGNAMNGVAFTFSSSNATVATVSGSGLVSGVSVGGATITASAGGQSAAASITVNAAAPTIARVAVNPATASVTTGQTAQLTAQAYDAAGAPINDITFAWTSSNPQVATVSASGLVSGVSAGTATIRATNGNFSGTATVTVSAPAPTPVLSRIAVTPASASITTGQTAQFSAQAFDQNNQPMSGVTFTWSSSNAAIASVSSSGLVTGVGAGSATITASSGGRSGSGSVAVSAPQPPPPPPSGSREFIFASDWSTATGNSPAAVTDGGRWQQISDNTTMEIVPSTGLDFPSANVYRAIATAERTGWSMVRKSGMPIPAVGERRYYRWYFRLLTPDGNGNYANHPIQDGFSASSSNWMFETVNGGNDGIPNGSWRPEFWLQGGAWPNTRWRGPILQKGVTYRFEFQIHRVSTTGFQMHVRMYDSRGNLIADDSNMRNDNGSTTLASNPTFPFVNVSWLDGLNAGNNGIHGTQPWPFTYAYEGAFAVCRGDWCGPYVAGEGR